MGMFWDSPTNWGAGENVLGMFWDGPTGLGVGGNVLGWSHLLGGKVLGMFWDVPPVGSKGECSENILGWSHQLGSRGESLRIVPPIGGQERVVWNDPTN